MRRILVLTALVVGFVAPLSAQASGIPKTGGRIGLLAPPPATFPADSPFYVTQGFTCETGKLPCLSGLTHFDLYVDGQEQPSATDLTFGGEGALLSKFNLSNFSGGLAAGTHTIRGEWYFLGDLVDTRTVTINFV